MTVRYSSNCEYRDAINLYKEAQTSEARKASSLTCQLSDVCEDESVGISNCAELMRMLAVHKTVVYLYDDGEVGFPVDLLKEDEYEKAKGKIKFKLNLETLNRLGSFLVNKNVKRGCLLIEIETDSEELLNRISALFWSPASVGGISKSFSNKLLREGRIMIKSDPGKMWIAFPRALNFHWVTIYFGVDIFDTMAELLFHGANYNADHIQGIKECIDSIG